MLTALYDGHCLICQSTCITMRKFDWLGHIEFVDLHKSASWRARFPDLVHERLMGECHVLDEAGDIYPGFHGIRRMLRELPLGFPLWLLLQAPGMTSLGKRIYRFVARNRYGVNKLLGNNLHDCADGNCGILQ